MSLSQVKISKGSIQGIEMGEYAVYKAIPYAKPPVGELRFRAPKEVDAWEGILEAINYAPKCMQEEQTEGFYAKEFYADPQYLVPRSEDCLYLNIWTPAKSSEEKLPVAVWIHGGAFQGGYGSEITFDGEAYCKHGVILVTINYRLGIWGFLTLPEMQQESEDGCCGNIGLLDQIAALKWVKKNIEAFGGDPENVTLFGQSAGSMSVSVLSCAEETQGLFQHAILQSGGGYEAGYLSHCLSWKEAAQKNEAYFRQKYPEGSLLEQLRREPAEVLQKQLEETRRECMRKAGGQGFPEMPFVFSVVKDGRILVDGLDEAIREGKLHDIDYIIGSNANDMGCNPEVIPHEQSSMYQSNLKWSILCDRQKRGRCYNYFFARKALGDEAGAFHSFELWYMFGTLGRSWRPKEEHDYRLSEEMLEYWTGFMKTGKPAGEEVREWSAFSEDHPYVHIFE